MEIQTIRYQKRFQFDIYVDPMIEDILIPPLSLQAFVENSMKYALGKEDCTKIQIDIRSFERDYFPYAEITMRDSGPGYPEEDLQKMNAGEKIVHADGSHIGISNTIQRLSIRFGSGFSYHFSNENGAVCRYTFPAVFSEDELHPADAVSSESIPLE